MKFIIRAAAIDMPTIMCYYIVVVSIT